jgi:hypothetical protein
MFPNVEIEISLKNKTSLRGAQRRICKKTNVIASEAKQPHEKMRCHCEEGEARRGNLSTL